MTRAMGRIGLAAVVLGLVVGGVHQVKADLIYSNGSPFGITNAWGIDYGNSVTDSFIVTSPTNLVEAGVLLQTEMYETITGFSWSIGTTPGGNDVSSGIATSSNIQPELTHESLQIDISVLYMNVELGVGTYWLTLSDATSYVSVVPTSGGAVWWGESDGPSTAYINENGNIVPIGSEWFSLYSSYTPISAPEPNTQILVALGAMGLVGYARRRRKAKHSA